MKTWAVILVLVFAAMLGPAQAQRGPGSPMRVLLLVDSSSATAQMLTAFRAGLNDFLDGLPGDPEIVMISTGGQLRIRVPPTTDRAKLREAARAFSSDGGGNSLVDTMIEADRRFLKSAPERRSIIVILTTDSGATPADARIDAYNRFADDFIKRGGRAHALVVRGLNSGLATQVTENITQNTGGFYEMVSVPTAVPKLMKSMAVYVAADQ